MLVSSSFPTRNLAAKLEKHCKVEDVRGLATMEALALARDQGYSTSGDYDVLLARNVEGVDEALDLVVFAA